VLPFVLAQLVGGAVGVGLAVVLYPARADAPPT
jgi:glycerol uptake facilitator-like aquaporin